METVLGTKNGETHRSGLTDKLAEGGYDLPYIRALLATQPLDQIALRSAWHTQITRAEHRHEVVAFTILLSTLNYSKAFLSPATKALLCCYQGVYEQTQSQFEDAEEYLLEALKLTKAEFYPDLNALILVRYAQLLLECNRFAEAEETLFKALTVAKSAKLPMFLAGVYNQLARLNLLKNNLPTALNFYQEAQTQIVLSSDHPDYFNEGKVLNGLGKIHFYQREWDKAHSFFNEALEVRTKIGDLVGQAETRLDMGIMARQLGKYEDASLHFNCALALNTQIKSKLGMAEVLWQQAKLAQTTAKYSEAQNLLMQALAVYREINNQNGVANCLYQSGSIYEDLKAYALAQETYEKALRLAQLLGDRTVLSKCYLSLADLLIEVWSNSESQTNLALAYYRDGITLLEQTNQAANLPQALLKLAKALNRFGDVSGQREALNYYSRCLKLLDQRLAKGLPELAARLESVQIYGGIGYCFSQLQEPLDTYEYYLKAISVLESLPEARIKALQPGQIYLQATEAAFEAQAFMEAFNWLERAQTLATTKSEQNTLQVLAIRLAPYKNQRKRQTGTLRSN